MAGHNAALPLMGAARLPWLAPRRHSLALAGRVLAALALAALLVSGDTAARAPRSTAASTPAPTIDFTVKDLAGNPAQLSAWRGHVVLVNFWASWCRPCQEEMPVLDAYYRAHQAEGFVLLAVNTGEDADAARAFVERYGYAFPVWSDPTGNSLLKLRIRGLPASVLFDEEGRVLERWLGPLTPELLEEIVSPHLPAAG